MRHRTTLLIVAVIVLGLLAIGGTVGAMALTHSGFTGNSYGTGMMNGQQSYGNMMGGPQQGTTATGITHMKMQNFAFQYAHMRVRAGTTMTWTNQDNAPHSVTFKNGMKDSGLLYQGQSFSYTFNSPGTYQYYCAVHPSMVATVTVTP